VPDGRIQQLNDAVLFLHPLQEAVSDLTVVLTASDALKVLSHFEAQQSLQTLAIERMQERLFNGFEVFSVQAHYSRSPDEEYLTSPATHRHRGPQVSSSPDDGPRVWKLRQASPSAVSTILVTWMVAISGTPTAFGGRRPE
jgi:hypothetical protein